MTLNKTELLEKMFDGSVEEEPNRRGYETKDQLDLAIERAMVSLDYMDSVITYVIKNHTIDNMMGLADAVADFRNKLIEKDVAYKEAYKVWEIKDQEKTEVMIDGLEKEIADLKKEPK